MASISRDARLTFIGLWTYVDDQGRGRDEPRLLKAALWPLDDDVLAAHVDLHLADLVEAGLIERYAVDGQRYLAVRNWAEHQKIDRPTKETLPPPPQRRATDSERSARTRRKLVEGSSLERKGKEGKMTWLTPFADVWATKCGTPPYGKLGKILSPLVHEHGEPEVLERWRKYVDATEPRYASVHRFAETFVSWAGPTEKEMTDDFGVMRLHRLNPASGQYEVAS
jgi:hypothetical protein